MTDDEPRDAADAGGPDAPETDLGTTASALLADPALWESPPADLGDRVVAAVRSEAVLAPVAATRRGTRSWIRPAALGAAAVVAFFLVGVVVLSAVNEPDGTEQFSADLVPTGLVADVDGSIEMTSFGSGLRIDLDAPSLPRRDDGEFYEAWLRTYDGLLVPVGTFHDGHDVVLWAGVERVKVVAFTISAEVAVEPDSVDQRPSGKVVLKADIPAP